MTVYSPKFAIPLMTDNPLTPDAIFNQAILILEMLAADTAIDYISTPPGSPVNGDVYIIKTTATGAWAGKDEQMAFYFDGWAFRPAPTNKRIFNATNNLWYYKTVTVWLPDSSYGVGKHTVWIPAQAILPALTNGCVFNTTETTTNKVNYGYMAFDQAVSKMGWFNFPAPKAIDLTTIKFRVSWMHSSGTTFGVVWRLQILSLADTDAIDQAVGAAIDITDTGGTANALYKSAESAAVTPSNTAAKGDLLACRIARMPADSSDTLDAEARLIGIEVFYNTDAGTDA